jgi:hypothetical protein
MNTTNRFLALFLMTVALLLLAACGAAQPTETTVPATEPGIVTYTPTVPELSVAPVGKSPAPVAAEDGDTTWDLIVLGDSQVAEGMSVLPERYAAHLEQDLDVKVEIQNLAEHAQTTRDLLANVQKYPWYRQPIQEADVILMSTGGWDLPGKAGLFFHGDCGGADNQDCLRQQLEESEVNYDALLAEIASLASPSDTLVRSLIPWISDFYARLYPNQPEDVAVFESYQASLYEHMAHSCAASGIAVLDLYQMYNGPNAEPDLPTLGSDEESDAIIAGWLSELGY